MTIRVSVIDKHPLMLEAVKLLLETDGEIEVVVRSPSVEDFLAEAKDRGVIIDVLLLDLILPGLSGPEAVAYLTEQGYKVVVLTAVDDRRTMAQVIQAGANGYILKTASVAEIRDAVMTVATGQMALDHQLALDVISFKVKQLSPREREVLIRLADGMTTQQIAESMRIAPNSVRTHIERIFKKLDVRSRLEAAAWAIRSGAQASKP